MYDYRMLYKISNILFVDEDYIFYSNVILNVC